MVSTSFNAVPKSPTKEQQIHPEFISVTSTPASFKKPPSIPISPNSFSISTSFSFPKKQYKTSLTYADEDKKNKYSLLRMDADEDYILDALWNDYSKIRTKLSF